MSVGRFFVWVGRVIEQRPGAVLSIGALWLVIEFVALDPYSYFDNSSAVHYASTARLHGHGGVRA